MSHVQGLYVQLLKLSGYIQLQEGLTVVIGSEAADLKIPTFLMKGIVTMPCDSVP